MKFVPRKKGPDIVTIIIYVLILIIFLKLLRIIPDPPEFDVDVVLGLLTLVTSILAGVWSWMSRKFTDLEDSLTEVKKLVSDQNERLIRMEEKIGNLEKNLSFHERLIRLEERAGKRK